MINTVTEYDFRDAFLRSETLKDRYSYEGLTALFEHLDNIDEETGHQTEFYPFDVAMRWSEMTLDEIRNDYTETETLTDDELIEWLEDRCEVIRVEGTTDIIISEF